MAISRSSGSFFANVPGALRWLERAYRMAPLDVGIAFALASARMRAGALGPANELLAEISARSDAYEIWFALADVRYRIGDHDTAAAALQRALSDHALRPSRHLRGLADDIVAKTGHPGWCGVLQDRRLVIRPNARQRPEIFLDGLPAAPGTLALPPGARQVDVTIDGVHLLGSPIHLRRIRRVEGIVRAADGGLEGWAWHPAAPELDPELAVHPVRLDGGLGPVILRLRADDQDMVATSPLSRPRRFRIPAAALAGVDGLVAITGVDGRQIYGSPLAPAGERHAATVAARSIANCFSGDEAARSSAPGLAAFAPADIRGLPVVCPPRPRRRVTIVVAVCGAAPLVAECLQSVLLTMPSNARLIVVDSASPNADVARVLAAVRSRGRVTLLRHKHDRGFAASANAGLRAAMALPTDHDVILLRDDMIVADGWIEALRAIVHGHGDIGTATPISNDDAKILSYPGAQSAYPAPDRKRLQRWARMAAAANGLTGIDIPAADGSCIYFRRECLADVGFFREDLFAQGHGESNDFCIRARHLGWRHVAAPGVFVAHAGGVSVGAARAQLIERNLDVLERVHPGYRKLIADFEQVDPLARARRRLDALRWRAGRCAGGAVILITHDSGGGVERVVRERSAAIRAAGARPIVLRPAISLERRPAVYLLGVCQVEEGAMPPGETGFPNLCFRVPEELRDLVRLLRTDRPQRIESHHLLGHDHAILRLAELLGIPVDAYVHDYALICPRISLVGKDGRYCGEPADPAVCEACVRDGGRYTGEKIGIAALRARSAADLLAARRIVVPSTDAAARLRRHFPATVPEVEPLEDDTAYPAERMLAAPPARIGIIGGIGTPKGYDVVLACARDAAARGLNLHFTVIGLTPDDARLMETGRVFVTGPYQEAEAVQLIRSNGIDVAWQPSIWPETWCFTLGIAWRAGLRVVAFDIGAPAERIRRTGRGWLLPLGLPPAAINSALLGLRIAPSLNLAPVARL